MCVSISLSRLHTHAAEGEEANNRVSVPSLSLCPHPSTTTPTKTHPHSVPPGTHRQSPVSVLSLLSYKARRPSRRRWRDGGRVTYQSLAYLLSFLVARDNSAVGVRSAAARGRFLPLSGKSHSHAVVSLSHLSLSSQASLSNSSAAGEWKEWNGDDGRCVCVCVNSGARGRTRQYFGASALVVLLCVGGRVVVRLKRTNSH